MQQLAGALGYTSQCPSMGGGASRAAGAVLVSPQSPELTDRMYADLIECLRYSRDVAEKRAEVAETRLQELYSKMIHMLPSVNEQREADSS